MPCLLAVTAVVFALLAPAPASARNIAPDLSWVAQPDWLNNPGRSTAVERTGDSVRFTVDAPGRGMKWSAALPEPVDLAETPWLVVRYRAKDAGEPIGYLVWLGGEGVEANAIVPQALVSDGSWRTLTSRIKPFKAKTIAVQLQAIGPDAALEISGIEFAARQPRFDPREAAGVGETAPGEFRHIDISAACESTSDGLVEALSLTGWFDHSLLSVSGVPFALVTGPSCLITTALDERAEVRLPLGGAVGSEVFVLAAGVSRGQPECVEVAEPHQFLARVTCEDGTATECVPARVTGRFGLTPGFAVYAVAAPGDAPLKELEIVENVRGMMMSVIAVTVGVDTNLAPHARVSPPRTPVMHSPPTAPAATGGTDPEFGDGVLSVMGGRLRISLEPAIAVVEAPADGLPGFAAGAALWRLRVGERDLSSADFTGDFERSADGGTVSLRDRLGLGITGALRVECLDARRVRLSLELSSGRTEAVQVVFPTVAVTDSSGGADLSYCFPRRGAVINRIPIELRDPYSGLMPLQFMDAWTPAGGVYVLTQDLQNVYRFFCLSKDAGGITMSVEYLEQQVGPSQVFRSVPTVVATHDGDWHTALEEYKLWVGSWYRPDAPRKDWFRQVFNFRQQFLRFYIPGGEKYYDKQTATYSFPEGLAADVELFGGVDYLHLFDWGASSKYGRTGDYEPWDEIGGVDAFRAAVAEAQDAGVPVGLYIEGYLVEPASRIGQERGADWQILDRHGKPLSYFLPAMNMCSAVVEWQDYLAAVYARVKDQTGAMGFYCDQMGFAAYDHTCYAANHGHPAPEPPLRGQNELLGKIRKAIGPEAALYTEEIPADVNSQRQDGSFTYSISTVSDAWSPSHLNLTRFALPDFKTFEIIVCDKPIADRLTAVRQIFFNGEGIWLEGPESWFAPEVLEFIRRMHRVMRAHSDCFTSLEPVPLVPTGHEMVFANEFPADSRTLWTLFNANYSAVRGEMLAVKHVPGAVYRDAWNGRELSPRIDGNVAYIGLDLGPRDIGCVVQTRPQAGSQP